jgi:hypothetical protein
MMCMHLNALFLFFSLSYMIIENDSLEYVHLLVLLIRQIEVYTHHNCCHRIYKFDKWHENTHTHTLQRLARENLIVDMKRLMWGLKEKGKF